MSKKNIELASIDWNQMSELGLLARINKQILHPLGLAVSRNPKNGHSSSVLVADDGFFEYDPKMKIPEFTDEEIKQKLAVMVNSNNDFEGES